MTYRSGVVACIKAGGKVLREQQDQVFLPFGTEYSLLIKNLKSLRVQVKVSIDGTDATEGASLIISPNSEIELERFIRAGNLEHGNRFKFIERSAAVEEHRGIQPDDGLVRIEYWTETPQPVIRYEPITHYYDSWVPVHRPFWPHYPYHPPATWMTGSSYRTGNASAFCCSMDAAPQTSSFAGQNIGGAPGITVPGSESGQRFYAASSFQTDPQSEVLILRLCGEVGGRVVERPVTVKTKAVCSTCGKSNEALAQFCSVCGTALELI